MRMRQRQNETFLIIFLALLFGAPFTAFQQPFISGKAHHQGIFNSFPSLSTYPFLIQMFCVRNCFIADECDEGKVRKATAAAAR